MASPLAKPKRQLHPILSGLRDDVVVGGVTLVQLGEVSGYSHEAISNWLCGRSEPLLGNVATVAEALGYEIRLVKKNG